ncbi:hypothetical protein PTTG_11022 [Puccinia triticina 1-1 BBBD Race 1]|uniref:Uncharacterized protein n=1 Tax=Puccinia triticina (isolate 1-1 / race 1 (BBBD)) TaxID=630390 RepID=A0A0C4FCR8_PUCT1|nr:hypothetical protein PTTG_11022 [Puccinia triticina 1-1 BBBD Race 1]
METKSVASHAFAPLVVGSAPALLPSGKQLSLTIDSQEPLPTPGPDPQDPVDAPSPMIPPSMTNTGLQAPTDTTTAGALGDPGAGPETKLRDSDQPTDPKTGFQTDPPAATPNTQRLQQPLHKRLHEDADVLPTRQHCSGSRG